MTKIRLMAELLILVSSWEPRPFQSRQVPAPILSMCQGERKKQHNFVPKLWLVLTPVWVSLDLYYEEQHTRWNENLNWNTMLQPIYMLKLDLIWVIHSLFPVILYLSLCFQVRSWHAQNIHNLLLSFVHLFTFGCFCKGTQMKIQRLTGSKCALNV